MGERRHEIEIDLAFADLSGYCRNKGKYKSVRAHEFSYPSARNHGNGLAEERLQNEERDQFEEPNWDDISPEAREINVEDIFKKRRLPEGDFCCVAYYDHSTKAIVLDNSFITSNHCHDLYLVDVILHEMFHAFQHYCVDELNKLEKTIKSNFGGSITDLIREKGRKYFQMHRCLELGQLANFAMIKDWELNLAEYIQPYDDIRGYALQIIETTANSFVETVFFAKSYPILL